MSIELEGVVKRSKRNPHPLPQVVPTYAPACRWPLLFYRAFESPISSKWLRERKGRTPGCDDILQYQNIIVALVETAGLMKQIDKVRSF